MSWLERLGCLMREEFWTAATLVSNGFWQLLNSNFFVALAGAFAGAYSAQLIVERSTRKRRLLEEIRNTNAAIMESYSIMNIVCTAKAQLINDIKVRYDEHRKSYDDFRSARNKGEVPRDKPFYLEADFRIISPIPVSTGTLQNLLFDKISVSGRPLSLLRLLSLSIDEGNVAIRNRNAIIEKCRTRSPIAPEELVSIYFGVPSKSGNIDSGYPDMIKAIYDNVDNCIFSSKTLTEDLIEHGLDIGREFGRRAPKIHKVDLTKALQAGLVPDSVLFEDWLRMHTPPRPDR